MRVLVLLILGFTALSAPAAAETFRAETFYLQNGLQVVAIENRRAPVVTHMIWYKFGAADEKPGESGIAHFLEHLMFKGTPTVPDGDFSRTVKRLGGNDNAFTSQDYTAYYQNIAREHLPRVMQMEADRMKNLELTESQVAAERQVIIEERRQRIDNQPQAKFNEQMRSSLFVNHPYGIPVIGWMHEMQELTREQALEYYQKWYAPNNAILIVAGDINAAELKPLAEKYYANLPVSEIAERRRPRPAPLLARVKLTMEDERTGQPLVMRLYRAPRGSDAADILAEIFGSSPTSRLYRKLTVESRIAVSAGVGYDPINLNETDFSIYAVPVPGVSPTQIEQAIENEIALLLSKGITLEELQAAKDRKNAAMTYYLDSLQGTALLFGRALSTGFDIDYLQKRQSRIDKLTIEDINAVAAKIFRADNIPVSGLLTQPVSSGKAGVQ